MIMNLVIRILSALLAGAVAFFIALQGEGSPIVIAITVFVLSAALLISDQFFTSYDGEKLVCAGLGSVIGAVAGYTLFRLAINIGYSDASLLALLFITPTVVFGFFGVQFARNPGLRVFGGGGFLQDETGSRSREKILDTSVIIDGRILDIAETHFLEGPFIIPNFVLREIQLISDSPDPIKRNRGRRGLEMLNKLQQHKGVKVKISYIDYSDTREVDAKLVKLSREMSAKLITNDFNLNKVAELQGVEVLNLNNLTNALKPVVLPGEDIYIDVIKEGKDENQGIGYLEDGTMVVVENGRNLLGKAVRVNVTSIIQTAAGKMIFTRATGDEPQPSSGNGGFPVQENQDKPEKDKREGGGSRRGRGRNKEQRSGNRR